MKRKAVSSDTADPGLSRGWAYFMEETTYKSYLSKLINELQPVCHTGIALGFVLILPYRKVVVPAIVWWMQQTQREQPVLLQQGLAATGVGTVDCA